MKSVDDLLTDWEDRSERGENPSAEELCAEYPQHLHEVRRQIQALQSFASRFGVHLGKDSDRDLFDETTSLPEQSIRITTEYQLERLHAVGGLGSVYLARDAGLNRRVALKFPRGKRHSEIIRTRFAREARITSRLDHPGIVPVHAIHSDDQGQLCYAMRFIEGDTLQAAIDRLHGTYSETRTAANLFRSVEFRDLLRRFQAVCNIAAYAHSQGVIHRDIKPSNIMLGAFGETLLVDWGLAKVDQQLDAQAAPDEGLPAMLDPTATRPGETIGTPAFASPEQLQGNHEQVTSLSDVYSLGATLFYLLTGKHLLSNSDLPKHLERIARGHMDRPSEILKGIPAPLDAICRHAIQVAPADRYNSPLELARDLESYMSDEPISIPCEGWRVRAGRWLRKHPVGVAVTLATVIVGLVAAVASSFILSDKNARLDKANKELTYSYVELSKAWGAKSHLQMQLDSSRNSNSQVLKALSALSDLHTSVYPDHTQFVTAADHPFLERLLERYLGFATYNGNTQEGRYVRAMGAWHAGGLLLALGRLPEAEAQLVAARRDLLLVQAISRVPEIDQCTARCCLLLAECYRDAGNSELAVENYRESLNRFDKLIERGMIGSAQPRINIHQAEAMCSLLELSENAASEVNLREALNQLRRQLENDLSRFDVPLHSTLMLARVLRTQAKIEQAQSHSQSLESLKLATQLYEQLLRDRPSHRRARWDLSECCRELLLAMSSEATSDPQLALLAASRQVSLLRELATEFPKEPKIRTELSSALQQRSQVRQSEGQAELAMEDHRAAEAIAKETTLPQSLLQSDGLGAEPFVTLVTTSEKPQMPLQPHRDAARKRFDLIESLEYLRKQYVREGNLDHAMVTWEREQRLQRDAQISADQETPIAELEQGLTPHHWIIDDGDITYVEIFGHTGGSAWGTGPYSDDSDLCTAAIHSGHLKPGEFKTIALRRVSGTSNYTGSFSHGVQTGDYQQFCNGYEIIASAVRLGEYNNVLVYTPEIQTVDVLVTGDSNGTVVGTDLYAVSSDLPAVAVHQGLLKHGERGIIHVEFLPPQDSYEPSTRHGVTSGTLINWPGTIRVSRVDLSQK